MAEGFGASPGLVGLLVGAYNLFYLLSSYLFGALADKYGGKYILRVGLFLSIVFFAAQVFAKDLFSLFIIRSLAGAGAGIFPAALTVYAYHEYKGRIGRFSGSGSLGWAIGAILAGLIASNQTIFAVSSAFFLIAFFVSLQTADDKAAPQKINLIPLRLIKKNAKIYVPYFFRQLGAQAVWAIFPLYLVLAGADKLWVGLAYFVNTFTQFFIMQSVEKWRNLYLVNIGLVCSVVTFAGYALFPYLPIVMIFQLLLAYAYSTLQVGAVQELLSKNLERSTAMSLLNSTVNLTAVIGPFLAGAIAEIYGYQGVMWLGATASLVGLVSFASVIE